MKPSIILPTYNEKEIIIKTINKIITIFNTNKIKNYEIIVVDDNSPDGTSNLVKEHFKTNKKVKIIIRKNKKGLSSAVIDGFNVAKGNLLFVMDADGQHDEKIIPQMIEKAKHSNIVIASRFIKGGSVEGWSKFRLFQSKVASSLAKPLLYFKLRKKISDPMSGFFCIKKETFNKSKSKLTGKGYKILLDILLNTPKNTKISEVPFKFKLREKGKSKLGTKVIFDYLIMLAKYYFLYFEKFIKFSIVGLTGVIINTFLLYFLTEFFHLFYLYSSIIAIEISIISNFLLNDNWTWKHTRKKHNFFHRFLRYHLTSFGGMIINFGTLFLLTTYLNIFYILSNLLGILLAVIWNFSINHIWTFKEK